jgi:hypothetical protein
MRFMMIMFPGPEAEQGVLPEHEQLMAEMGKFNEEMVKAGVLLAGEGLHPLAAGARVRFPNGKARVSDGPFTEAKEIVGGFWMIQVASKEEAIAWASRCPNSGKEMIEIRRVYEAEDFAAADPTGELRANEERLRKLAAANRA